MTVPRRVVLPAAPNKVMEPVPALKVILPGPLRGFWRVIGLEAVVKKAFPTVLTAPAKLIDPVELNELLRVEVPAPI